MRLRVNLFFKIFLGFWLATIVIASSWMLVNRYFESQPAESAVSSTGERQVPHRFMLRKLYDIQNTELEQLPDVLRNSGGGQVTAYLLDERGNDWLEREVSPAVLAAARQLDRRRRGFVRAEGVRYVAHQVWRSDIGRARAVFRFGPPPPTVLGALGASPGLRLALAVGISGLLCYLLSRLLTSRLTQLGAVSRRFAQGDLDARAPVRERGGDETDQLARDFNTMAGQLQERITAQKQLLSDVSHELRSPLARLRVALALAQENPTTTSEALARIEQESERLEALIAQLLRSQAESPSLDAHIDLVSLLESIVSDARFECSAQDKQVELHCQPAEAIIATSGDLLHRTFENIVRNAINYSTVGGIVTVTLDSRDECYVIAVENPGSGVPERDLERIFSEFYRVDSARSRSDGGHGLGLAIARRAVELHDGTIAAKNTSSGFCVTITLPRPEDSP